MNHQEFFNYIKNNAKPENQPAMTTYMKNQYPFLGIKTPERRQLSKNKLKELKQQPKTDWQFIKKCWKLKEREYQYIATDYLNLIKEKLKPEDIEKIKELITEKSWWDTVDALSGTINQLTTTYPELNPTIIKWSLEENIWLRRTAIIHQLLRKEKTNTSLLAEIIENNIGTKEFFINKAIGWALRDYSKTNPEWVRNYIQKHQKQLSPLSIKEGSKHLKVNK